MEDLAVIYGSEPRAMVIRLLETLIPVIHLPRTARIALKPNLFSRCS